jgi:hypothetical protein
MALNFESRKDLPLLVNVAILNLMGNNLFLVPDSASRLD